MAIWPKLLIAGATTIAGIVAAVAGINRATRPTEEDQEDSNFLRVERYEAENNLMSAAKKERMAAEKLAAQQAEVEAAKRERIAAEQELLEAIRRERTATEQELAESEKHVASGQKAAETAEGEQDSCDQHFPLKMDTEDAVADQDTAAEWTDASPVEDDSTKGDAENEF